MESQRPRHPPKDHQGPGIPGCRYCRLIPLQNTSEGSVHAGNRLLSQCRGDVQDLAAALTPHLPDGLLRDEEEAFEVRAHHALKFLLCVLVERLRDKDARIVDQHVQTSESAHGGLNEPGPRSGVANVAIGQQEIRAGLQLPGRSDGARVRYDVKAFVAKRVGQREADPAAGRSGD